MVKGGDWAYGCQLVDEAFAALPGPGAPPRLFTPMVLTDTGAKLSKSLIREGTVPPPPGARPWMLDATAWDGSVGRLRRRHGLAGRRHARRPQALLPLLHHTGDRPPHDPPHRSPRPAPRPAHEPLPPLLRPGRLRPQEDRGPRPVRQPAQPHRRPAHQVRLRPATTPSPASPASPATPPSRRCSTPRGQRTSTRTPRASSSSTNIRRIYGPEKEALGVLAIEIERVTA